MTQVIRLNNAIRCIFVLSLAGWMLSGCQMMVEHEPAVGSAIHTLVHKETVTLFPTDFSMQHTIHVSGSGPRSLPLPLLSDMLKEQGFKVTSSKDEADYVMHVTAFVTMPFKEDGRAMPYSAEYLLSMREQLPVIRPLLHSDESPQKQMENMAKLVRQSNQGIWGSDTSNTIALGTTFGDGMGGLAAGAAAGIIDAVSGITSQHNIREGLAGFRFSIHATKGMLNQVFGLNIYAASTDPEHPETLLRAAIERAAIEMGKKASW